MDITLTYTALIPVIIGLVAAVKKAGIPSRWLPLTAILFGLIGVWVLGGATGVEWLAGVVAGLSAVGLHSGTKATLN